MIFERKVIYAQDIMIFTGRSRSYAYKVLKQMKGFYGKSKANLLTIQEFADYHGISVADVESSVLGKPK
ncbi:hypothetical protein SYJ56_25705 [Algoriphagus sp. D3-2-R+10]|uniref:hypothetical protein n=1 Tax=Algoriphagus aurantiacus TaxID=3103948 RepID=UPI002B3DB42A|nr:hypothetical protein [Algoriphagus sp. D3-2-R+10]MEB2778730.1 hypothetical protein [Algoriphagus sp. D3-2-R+10]